MSFLSLLLIASWKPQPWATLKKCGVHVVIRKWLIEMKGIWATCYTSC